MMAMPATLSSSGVAWSMPDGAPEDLQSLRDSYEHLIALRDQTIEDGILPPVSEWKQSNPHLT
jgi:malate dehydrogenase